MKKIIFSIGICLVLAGCATADHGGFLDTYEGMTKGKHLEQQRLEPDLKLGNNTLIDIKQPSVEKLPRDQEALNKRYQTYLHNVLEKRLSSISGVQIETGEKKEGAAGGERWILETAITDLDPGSRLARWMAGELGAGHSYVQVEGIIRDASTQKVLMRFADKRAGSGTGGLDITGGDPDQMMEADLDGIAKALTTTLKELK